MKVTDNFSIKKDVFLSKNGDIIIVPVKTYDMSNKTDIRFIGSGTYHELVGDIKHICNYEPVSFFKGDYPTLNSIRESWQASIILLGIAKQNLLSVDGVRNACDNKAYLDIQDSLGLTPLMYTAMNDDCESGRALIQKGASCRIMNNNGYKARDLAKPYNSHIYGRL